MLALDYLMLTQGWRRFNWEEVLWEQPMAMEYFQEEAKIKGRVVDIKGDPMANTKVQLLGTNLIAASDENGYFSMDTLINRAPEFNLISNKNLSAGRIASRFENGGYILEAPIKLLNYMDIPIAAASGKKEVSKYGETQLKGTVNDFYQVMSLSFMAMFYCIEMENL